ncbi:hypothetical protein [Algibacter pacificus]|uniref:hypothetical protein n=1 Tax=Algibacter pacificus TaxID=2599389 RepID=UPI0011CA891B|nr:hypothetical protein [Algibacter pacificus]
MKTFFKNITFFGSVFFVLAQCSYFILDRASSLEYDKRLEMLMEGEINKELLVFGSSRGSGNILAAQLEKETGFSSYNLSYQAANLLYQEFILKTVIAYNNPPKKIVMAIDNPAEFNGNTGMRFRNDRLFPLSKYNYINSELINQDKRTVLSKLLYIDRVSTNMFKTTKVNPPSLNPFESCGSRPIILKPKGELVYSKVLPDYSIHVETASYIQAFKNMQSICKKNNIQIIFVFPPNFMVFNSNFYNRFKQLMFPENKVFVYDTLNPAYKNDRYFYDVSHLTKDGAKIFTTEISQFIKSL